AVRDHEHVVARMPCRDLQRRPHCSLRELLARLAVVADLAAEPAGIALRESLLYLGAGQARPGADVDLAERRVLDDREVEPPTDRACRLARTDEIARVDGDDPVAREPVRELGGLASAGLVERRVGVPLPAADPVPVGFAVAGEKQSGRR